LNPKLLHKDVQSYINDNLKADISKLLFKGSPFEDISIQELVIQIDAKKRCEKKLPTWFRTTNIYYPNKLNIEQTSSERTAHYKSKLISGDELIDLTGGFGVDTFYFSKHFRQVTHCEHNIELSEIAAHNFKQLNADIKTISGNGLAYLEDQNKKFDWIYIDPSRRSDAKGKVFLLKDCIPYIPHHLDLLFKYTSNIIIKVAPLLDITSAINELCCVKEVHVVAVDNEVKELLFILKRNYSDSIHIKTVNLKKEHIQLFNADYNLQIEANFSEPLNYLYEPNSAILKSGLFNEVSSQLNVFKLHNNSHLYTSIKLIDFPGRRFSIKYIIPYDKKQIKQLIPSKKAHITTRNFPETVAQIRKKTGFKEGGEHYLFFTTNILEKHIVIVCEKV